MKTELLLTDITLHAKDMRPTPSYEKAVARTERGVPSPRFYSSSAHQETMRVYPDGRFEIVLQFPPDVQEKINRGEITISPLRTGGIPVYPSRDLVEYMGKMNRAQRRQLIHRGRTWHAGRK